MWSPRVMMSLSCRNGMPSLDLISQSIILYSSSSSSSSSSSCYYYYYYYYYYTPI
eukprot:COSAG05_NODE_541_length_8832_cov_190.458491_6_plen_55_part_00